MPDASHLYCAHFPFEVSSTYNSHCQEATGLQEGIAVVGSVADEVVTKRPISIATVHPQPYEVAKHS